MYGRGSDPDEPKSRQARILSSSGTGNGCPEMSIWTGQAGSQRVSWASAIRCLEASWVISDSFVFNKYWQINLPLSCPSSFWIRCFHTDCCGASQVSCSQCPCSRIKMSFSFYLDSLEGLVYATVKGLVFCCVFFFLRRGMLFIHNWNITPSILISLLTLVTVPFTWAFFL